MPKDAQPWDDRYRADGYPAGTEPAAFLCEVLPLLPRGRALDLAMGAGRNAVFLAEHGCRVTGIDSSRAALEKAATLARQRGVVVNWARQPCWDLPSQLHGLLLLEADLESCALPPERFDLVVCFYYLQRSLITAIARALRPGGMLIYETYTVDQLAFPGGSHNPEHLLRPGELRDAFANLHISFYREFRAGKGIASLLARRP